MTAVSVSFEAFLRDGVLGPVCLGMSDDEVLALLGPPEDTGGTSRRKTVPPIWVYGDVELCFERDRRLWLIHLDEFEVPAGGRTLAIDPWFIQGGVTVAEAEAQLRAAAVAFSRGDGPEPCGVLLTTQGSVQLFFAPDGTGPDPRLYAVSASTS